MSKGKRATFQLSTLSSKERELLRSLNLPDQVRIVDIATPDEAASVVSQAYALDAEHEITHRALQALEEGRTEDGQFWYDVLAKLSDVGSG